MRLARWVRAGHWCRLLPLLILLFVVAPRAWSLAPAEDWGTAVDDDAWQLHEDYWAIPMVSTTDGFTLRTVVTVNDAFTSEGKALVLAGASSSPAGWPDALRVIWGPSSSGWAVLWSLRLESDIDLLMAPAGERVVKSVDLYRGYPLSGHQYETLLSYDPVQGWLEITVTDLTSGTIVYQAKHRAAASEGETWLGAGVRTTGAPGWDVVSVDRFGVQPASLPVATTWTLSAATEDGRLRTQTQFDTASDVVVTIAAGDAPQQGEYRLLRRTPTGEEILRVLPTGQDHTFRLAQDELPVGRSTLLLQYAIGDVVLLSESRTLTIGRSTFTFSGLEIDRSTEQIRGVLTVSSVDALENVHLTVEARIHEKVWDQSRRDYINELLIRLPVVDASVTVSAGEELVFPFSVPLPDKTGFYELMLVPSTEPAIVVDTVGAAKLFHTYEPAVVATGEPFTIAVLPDTQNYAAEYPTTFIRQTQWIAENAKERNILLALHLGDITNDNTPLQWQRAVQAMTLLDGVVPYVLSQGNHDMTAAGGGNVADRNHSRINEYFPLETQPWIKGTFEPGKVENSYATFNLAGDPYLVVSLEFGARDEALAWANEVVQQYPDHKVIVITHVYTTRSGRRSTSAEGYAIAQNRETTVNNGDQMWAKFVSRHPNILMVLSGHHNSENGISRQVARGIYGNPVYEMMINYQFDTGGGDGHLALIEFRDDGLIEVRAYSPYLDVYRNDVSIFGFNNHFFIDLERALYLDPAEVLAVQ